MIRAIVFDLDGTLIDSRHDIADALNVALRASGRNALAVEEISRYVGDGAKRLVSRAARLPDDSPELESLVESFLAHYTAHPAEKTRLVLDARSTLDALEAEHALALLTNKPRKTTDAVLRALGIDSRFRITVAGGDLPEKKPHPLPLFHIARQLGFELAQTVMVGDGPQDILCGRAAGTLTVGVEGGFSTPEELRAVAPDALLPRLGELVDWVFRRRADDTPR